MSACPPFKLYERSKFVRDRVILHEVSAAKSRAHVRDSQQLFAFNDNQFVAYQYRTFRYVQPVRGFNLLETLSLACPVRHGHFRPARQLRLTRGRRRELTEHGPHIAGMILLGFTLRGVLDVVKFAHCNNPCLILIPVLVNTTRPSRFASRPRLISAASARELPSKKPSPS